MKDDVKSLWQVIKSSQIVKTRVIEIPCPKIEPISEAKSRWSDLYENFSCQIDGCEALFEPLEVAFSQAEIEYSHNSPQTQKNN